MNFVNLNGPKHSVLAHAHQSKSPERQVPWRTDTFRRVFDPVFGPGFHRVGCGSKGGQKSGQNSSWAQNKPGESGVKLKTDTFVQYKKAPIGVGQWMPDWETTMVFEIYEDCMGNCLWRLRVTSTGSIVALSPRVYANIKECEDAIRQVIVADSDTAVQVTSERVTYAPQLGGHHCWEAYTS